MARVTTATSIDYADVIAGKLAQRDRTVKKEEIPKVKSFAYVAVQLARAYETAKTDMAVARSAIDHVVENCAGDVASDRDLYLAGRVLCLMEPDFGKHGLKPRHVPSAEHITSKGGVKAWTAQYVFPELEDRVE
jgi:hypothetical protein